MDMVARYGRAPETVGQWDQMNGFTSGAENSVNPALLPHNDPRRIAWTQQIDAISRGGGANNPAPQQRPNDSVPVPPQNQPQQQPPAASGSPMGYDAYLQQLMGKVNSYDPTAGINSAFDAQTQAAIGNVNSDAARQQGYRGLLPSDNTSQDLKAVLTGKAMAPIAQQRAMALANAGQQGLSNQMSLAGMLGDAQRANQQQTWQQQQFEYTKSQDAANRAFQQQQADWQRQQQGLQNQQWQSQFDWTRQQQGVQNVHSGATDPSGNAIAPQQPQQQAPAGGGSGGAEPGGFSLGNGAAIAAAGGGYRTLAEVLAAQGHGGGGAPGASSPGMGGGAGLGSYNSGNGPESSGYYSDGRGGSTPFRPSPRPFEGPGTSTVGTASGGGPTTMGTGTRASNPMPSGWSPSSSNTSPLSARPPAPSNPMPSGWSPSSSNTSPRR